MWLARNKKGNLTVHRKKPFLKGNGWWTSDKDTWTEDALFIDDESEFPEVTFENSPIEITSLKNVLIAHSTEEINKELKSDLYNNNKSTRKELVVELKRRMLLKGIQKGESNALLWYGNFQYAMNEDCTNFKLTFPIRYVTSLDERGENYTLAGCPLKFIQETLKLNPSK